MLCSRAREEKKGGKQEGIGRARGGDIKSRPLGKRRRKKGRREGGREMGK